MKPIQLDGQTGLPQFEYLYDGAMISLGVPVSSPGLDLALMRAQIGQESMFSPLAVSPTGPRGLGQFAKATWEEIMGPEARREDIYVGLTGLKFYMTKLIKWAEGLGVSDPKERIRVALAAYNQGMGTIEKARTLVDELKGDPGKWDNLSAVMDRVVPIDRAIQVRKYVKIIEAKADWYRANARPNGGTQ